MKTRRDERGVIVTWMARIVVWFAIVAVLLFDAAAIVVNYVGLESSTRDVANTLARDMVQERRPLDQTQLVASARSLTSAVGARLRDVRIDPQGVLHVRTTRSANTLIVSRIEALRRWGQATATARAATTPSSAPAGSVGDVKASEKQASQGRREPAHLRGAVATEMAPPSIV